MDDLARELGISKKTIYGYYDSKDSLVYNAVRDHMAAEMCETEDIVKAADNAPTAMINIARMVLKQLRKLGPKTIHDLRKYHKDAFDLLHVDYTIFIKEVIMQNLAKGKEEGLYLLDIDDDVISTLYINMLRTLTDQELFPPYDYARALLFEQMIKYHLRGITTEKGRKILANQSL